MARNRSRLTFVLSLLLMLFLAACNDQPSNNPTGVLDPNKQYTVNFWEAFATGTDKATLEAMTKQYQTLHPNVTVNLQAFDSSATLKAKLTSAVTAGKPPTIAQVYEGWTTQYQQTGALVSLQPLIGGKDGLKQADLLDFYAPLLQDGQIGGVQYAMPFSETDMVLYYNVDALQKLGLTPPKTMRELEAELTSVTKTDGSQWGLSLTPSADEWSILYKAFGGSDFVSADGQRSTFATGPNSQKAKQALSELAPLVKAGAVHITQDLHWQNDFATQKSLFAIGTTADYSSLASAIGSRFRWTAMPMPTGPSGPFTTLFGTNLALFFGADADSQMAGWDYMKYLTSTEANTVLVRQAGYVPIRQSVFNSSTLQDYYRKTPARKAGPQSLNSAFIASTLPAWEQCRTIITTDFTAVLNGQSATDAALKNITDGCDAALAQG